MSEDEEVAYKQGDRQAWLRMLSVCISELGYTDIEAQKAKWITEREQAIESLRDLCRHVGDNDWDEKLQLANIIDTHLGEHVLS